MINDQITQPLSMQQQQQQEEVFFSTTPQQIPAAVDDQTAAAVVVMDRRGAGSSSNSSVYRSSTANDAKKRVISDVLFDDDADINWKSIEFTKPTRARSTVWNEHFGLFPKATLVTENFAACKLCFALELKEADTEGRSVDWRKFAVNYGASKSTGHLSQHLEYSHPKLFKNQNESVAAKHFGSGKSLKEFMDFTTTFQEKALEWLIMTYQPLNTFDNPNFCAMINACASQSGKYAVTSKNIRTSIIKQATGARVLMKEILDRQEDIAITLDAWTSNANQSYLGLNVHFIDEDWNLHTACLKCGEKDVSLGSTAGDLVAELKGVLQVYNIPPSKVAAVLTDTEATMNLFGKLIKEDPQLQICWLGCFAHILELSSGLAFGDNQSDYNAICMRKARGLVGHFKHSTQKADLLRAKQANRPSGSKEVLEDVATRWWSTYQMVQRLLDLQVYIQLLATEGHIPVNLQLTGDEWLYLNEVKIALEPLFLAQHSLEAEKNITISSVSLALNAIRKQFSAYLDNEMQSTFDGETQSDRIVNLISKINKSFSTHWGVSGSTFDRETRGYRQRTKGLQTPHILGSALDPRTKKLKGILKEEREHVWAEVTDVAEALYLERKQKAIQTVSSPVVLEQADVYNSSTPLAQQEGVNKANNNNTPKNKKQKTFEQYENLINRYASSSSDDEDATGDSEQEQLLLESTPLVDANKKAKMAIRRKIDAEVVTYVKLTFSSDEISTLKPLLWWNQHSVHFPHLARLAKRFLCVPATSAPVERLFSTAGLVITEKRGSLTPDVAQDIVFLHESLSCVQHSFQMTTRNRIIQLDSAIVTATII